MRIVLFFLILLLAACDDANRNQIVDGPLPEDKFGPSIVTRANSLSELGKNGLRLFVQPSFGVYHYQFDFVPRPEGCLLYKPSEDYFELSKNNTMCWMFQANMRRETLSIDKKLPTAIENFQFAVPEEEMRVILSDLEDRIAQWTGEVCCTIDGTGLSFEYIRSGDVKSMSSNSNSADSPVSQLGSDIHRLALAYGPTGTIPRTNNWTVSTLFEFDCGGTELNTTDVNGYGVGNDDCAVFIEKQIVDD